MRESKDRPEFRAVFSTRKTVKVELEFTKWFHPAGGGSRRWHLLPPPGVGGLLLVSRSHASAASAVAAARAADGRARRRRRHRHVRLAGRRGDRQAARCQRRHRVHRGRQRLLSGHRGAVRPVLRADLGTAQGPDAPDAWQSRVRNRRRQRLLQLLRRERRSRRPRLLQLRGRQLAHRLVEQQRARVGRFGADAVAAPGPRVDARALRRRHLAPSVVLVGTERPGSLHARRLAHAARARRRRRHPGARSHLRAVRPAGRERPRHIGRPARVRRRDRRRRADQHGPAEPPTAKCGCRRCSAC